MTPRFENEPIDEQPRRDALNRRLRIRCPECGCDETPIVDHTATPADVGMTWSHECQSCGFLFRVTHFQPAR
jgi:DNA-directed RNA polymerase subunit M/transcription elongation factor TFIIS